MRKTKAEKFADIHHAFKCVQGGLPVKRSGAKDGSIPTHPDVYCPELSEHDVQEICIEQLKKWRIFGNRSNVGSGTLVSTDKAGMMSCSGTYRRYGIKDAGDWIGLLPDGRHLEIEFKKGHGGRLTKGQQKRMQDIRYNNGLYFVIHGLPELRLTVGKELEKIQKQKGLDLE